jgi:hypothetical protein
MASTASIEVTIDLPTPPLPLITAITFLIFESLFAGASRLSALRSALFLAQVRQSRVQVSLILFFRFIP